MRGFVFLSLMVVCFAGQAAFGQRVVRVVSPTALAGTDAVVSVEIDAQGNEFAGQFSLAFNPALMSISSANFMNPDVSLGSGVPAGTVVTVNGNQAASGQIGVLVDSAGPYAVSPPAREVVRFTFHIAPGTPDGCIPVSFSSTPLVGLWADGGGNILTASYVNGCVNVGTPTPTPTPTPPTGRVVRVADAAAAPGMNVVVPISLDSQGNEAAGSFTVTFDPTKLTISGVTSPGTNPDVALGSGVPPGTHLTVNGNQAASGQIGILVDSTNAFSASPPARHVIRLMFHVAVGVADGCAAVGFSSSPTPRSWADTGGNLLTASYVDGCVNVNAALDSDGDGVVDTADLFPFGSQLPTVAIDDCDSGVGNHGFATGANFVDLILDALATARNHGQYVSSVSHMTNDWRKDGLITNQQRSAIRGCAH